MNPRLTNARSGFTLVEILIAMAIIAVLLSAMYSSWSAILRSAQVGHRAAAEVQRTRMALQTLQTAAGCAVLFEQNLYYYSFETVSEGGDTLLSFVARLPGSFPGSGLFPGQPVRRVTFSAEPSTDGAKELLMTQTPILQVLEQGQEPYPLTLARDVSRFEVEFWDSTIGEWGLEWGVTNEIPPVIRITLGLKSNPKDGSSGREHVYTRVALLPARKVPREFQSPSLPGQPAQLKPSR